MTQEFTGEPITSQVPFVKMQGVGNDFVVIGEDALALLTAESLAIALCERRFGIGADGLLIIGAPTVAEATYSFAMRNPDGTPDMCGNGMRCAALYAYKIGLVTADAEFRVQTQDGLLACRILSLDDDALTAQVRVQMAVPLLTAAEIPFTGITADEQVVDYPLEILGQPFSITAVNTGSTHSVAFRDAMPADNEFISIGPAVEYHPDFPERTSLIWTVQRSPSRFSVRIWERGAGETLGCGTGACAAAVAAIITGRADPNAKIEIESRGGVVQVEWPAPHLPVTLTGPAVWVFSGETRIAAEA